MAKLTRVFLCSQFIKTGGGRCPYGGWQVGKDATQKGSTRHHSALHKTLKNEMKKTTVMNRIRAAETEALKVIRTINDRDAVEAKRKDKKRKETFLEESDGEEEELLNDLDD